MNDVSAAGFFFDRQRLSYEYATLLCIYEVGAQSKTHTLSTHSRGPFSDTLSGKFLGF